MTHAGNDSKPSTTTAAPRRPDSKPTAVLSATVIAHRRISPSFARLTLAGRGVALLERKGFDQWFRLFFEREGEGRLALPTAPLDPVWYQRFLAAPDHERTWMRYVTVREHRLAGSNGPEIDVDVVVHGQPGEPGCGPLSNWALTAREGQRVALLDQGPIFRQELVTEELLLVGDETAVPAVAGILQALPPDARGHAYLEVPYAEDIQELVAPPGLGVTWLSRDGSSRRPGSLAVAAVKARVHEHRQAYVYAAGEAGMMAALNQLLRQDLGWAMERMAAVIYWHDAAAGA